MKNFLNITILILSIGFISTPALAMQVVDPSDYVGYTHSANASVELARDSHSANDRESRRIGELLWNQDNDDREARRVGKLLWNQDTDDLEARRVGKLLWNQDADDREARRVGKLLWNQDANDREARRVGKLLWKQPYSVTVT